MNHKRILIWPACILLLLAGSLNADDWPEWRGKGRLGVWDETGIIETFPSEGLRVKWRTPVRAGYSSPSVAGGRVFVTDFVRGEGTAGTERAIALDEKTGRILWTREWETDYQGIDYAVGPRAAPTVDGERVYTLGTMGVLHCLDVKTGEVLWKKDYVRDFGTQVPNWGMAGAPLVDGNRLIAVAGGSPNAKVMAFDKETGRELWRALSSETSEPGYSQPILITAGGKRQLIVWHAGALASLDPETGELFWEQPFKIRMNTPIATPVQAGPHLLVSAFFNGARLYRLHSSGPQATLVWRGMSDSEVSSDGLHSLMATPVIDGDYIYGFCSYGQLRCLRLSTGERIWENQQATVERVRNSSAFLIRHHDRVWIHNDRGELIIARLSPAGYEEIDRAELIRPTSPYPGRRERGAVSWSHPAFANRHVFARNDEEIISVSLAAEENRESHRQARKADDTRAR